MDYCTVPTPPRSMASLTRHFMIYVYLFFPQILKKVIILKTITTKRTELTILYIFIKNGYRSNRVDLIKLKSINKNRNYFSQLQWYFSI